MHPAVAAQNIARLLDSDPVAARQVNPQAPERTRHASSRIA